MKMKLLLIICAIIFPVILLAENTGVEKMNENIHWYKHDSFMVKAGGKVIYFDPWEIDNPEKADIILVTHEHFDHFSIEDIKKMQKEGTVIVSTQKVTSQCTGKTKAMLPGEKTEIDGITIEAVPSYNVNKKFHPKENKNLGFIVTVDGVRIYHAGDTDVIPEMKDFKVDIALLPVSGTYVMTAEEAVEAAKIIKPKIAIPMHYGKKIGTMDDPKTFEKGLKGIVKVIIKQFEN